ncbi:protein snakeskin-like [Venturia canescens]|uniref:protein snakeskin-like n=1 Tax=Venturia canescens TaxID=32260 RepID=UPI001C9D49A7|nr:protein snakeskin-like [Venturia canescens]
MANITRLAIIKFLELILVCIIIGLHYRSFNAGQVYEAMITNGTIGGYLIILVGLLAGGVMGTPVNRRVDLFFSLIGCALFIATGSMVIDTFQHIVHSDSFRDTGLAKGSLCIFEGAFFLVDAILTFRGES